MRRLLLLLFSLTLLMSCSVGVRHNQNLEQSILSAQKKDTKVDLNELTDFKWDKAFLFPPYTDQATINETLGFTFNDPSEIKNRDDIYLLIFVNEEKVVQYAKVSRKYGELIPEEEIITPSKAVLKVARL
ncbi:hypothetical protein [Bacillus sp. NEB1478]|uniref:hypothetical protein n=1 Tax=Bacillus sp. NEB1478 TaxID=3073816 RepID=UPI00287309CA|nr:hypothetical protein [Bacillus sp. NEB1478]WNB91011.1 hypothetical protein RGB74_14000 [Bacillus sp. NEB1478]